MCLAFLTRMFYITPLRLIVSMCVCVCTRVLCTVYTETLNAPLPKFSRHTFCIWQHLIVWRRVDRPVPTRRLHFKHTHCHVQSHINIANMSNYRLTQRYWGAASNSDTRVETSDVEFNNAKLTILYRMLQF